MKEENQILNIGGERKPRFTGLMKKTKVYRLNEEKDQGLQVGRRDHGLEVAQRKRTKGQRLYEEREQRFTGWKKKKNKGWLNKDN